MRGCRRIQVQAAISIHFAYSVMKTLQKLRSQPTQDTRKAFVTVSIGHDKRDSHLKSEVPGPGSYNSHEIKAHLQVAIRSISERTKL